MLKFISKFLPRRKEVPINPDKVKYLIVGLGNIGPDYENTRHNIGFKVIDYLAGQKNVSFSKARYGDMASFRFKGRTFIIVKPGTYMNLSGKAIDYWMKKEKIEPDKLLVIVDDVALPLGNLRLKANGGAGGHNGLENIISVLGTNQFSRLRFGIGNDFPKGAQVHFVLGKWEPIELDTIEPKLVECAEIVISFATQGIERTMNHYNKKQKDSKSDTKPETKK